MYHVKFLKKAVEELKSIDPIWQKRIKLKIDLLALDPNSLKRNIKRLKGKYHKYARLRVGNYRIIFKVQKNELIIIVIRIAHRREIY